MVLDTSDADASKYAYSLMSMSRLELSGMKKLEETAPMPNMPFLEKRIWRRGPWEVFVRRMVGGEESFHKREKERC